MSAPDVVALDLRGVPGNTAREWHFGRTIDNIAHRNTQHNRVLHMFNELANLTASFLALTGVAKSDGNLATSSMCLM